MNLSTNVAINAIYYALWQGGYEYARFERDAAHMEALSAFASGKQPPFYAKVRQSTCEVYNFWPRAALLEMAAFHVDEQTACYMDEEALRMKILSAPNITDEERNDAFWSWLADFPAALCEVLKNQRFRQYMAWAKGWVHTQNARYECELAQIERCLIVCRGWYESPLKNVQLLIDPIKCVYSADYQVVEETFVFSSGRLSVESVIHEYLHHVVHPFVMRYQEQISREDRKYPGLDASYYAAGRLYAFEEYVVRQLTRLALTDDLPQDLSEFVQRCAAKK